MPRQKLPKLSPLSIDFEQLPPTRISVGNPETQERSSLNVGNENRGRYRLLSAGLIARCKIVRRADRTRARLLRVCPIISPLQRWYSGCSPEGLESSGGFRGSRASCRRSRIDWQGEAREQQTASSRHATRWWMISLTPERGIDLSEGSSWQTISDATRHAPPLRVIRHRPTWFLLRIAERNELYRNGWKYSCLQK